METNEQVTPKPPMSQEEMMREIYENTRKAKNYMMWQLYITIILVVLPLLAALFIVPIVMRNVVSSYGSLIQ